MFRNRSRVVWVLGGILMFRWFAAAVTADAEDPKQIVQQANNTELCADHDDHSRWLYFDADRKPGNDVAQWVAQTVNGDVRGILEKDSQRIPLIEGHALLFKSIAEQEDEVKTKFQQLPDNVSLQQAEKELLKQGS
jgi:hypothetical protein